MKKKSKKRAKKPVRKTPIYLLARAGVTAALYAVMTYAFGSLAFGPLQIRPAEALCVLPLFFPETVVGLFVGCALSNLISGFGALDIIVGSLTTLLAAMVTCRVGKVVKNRVMAIILGGLPPVLLNAFAIPIVIIVASPNGSFGIYWMYFLQLLLTQAVWVYALGAPLAFGVGKMRERSVRYLK